MIINSTPEMSPDEAADVAAADAGYDAKRQAAARAGEPLDGGSIWKTFGVILGSVALLGWARSKVLS